MNLGFTEITFLYNNVPISEASLGDVDTTVTAYGTTFRTLGTPFRYAYVTPSERYTPGTASTAILKASVWMGHDVVNGINRDYGLTDTEHPPLETDGNCLLRDGSKDKNIISD